MFPRRSIEAKWCEWGVPQVGGWAGMEFVCVCVVIAIDSLFSVTYLRADYSTSQ